MRILLSVIVGWGLSAAFWMHIWLPDPPPDGFTRFLSMSVAGIVGGVVGGAIGAMTSDPMPAHPVAGAAAGSLLLTGALLAMTVKGRAGRE
jgi:hypothetical protein